MKLLIMQFSPISRHFICLRSKYGYLYLRTFKIVFTNIAETNKLLLQIHLTNTKPRAYEYFNKLTFTD
jgi:hypothetical protein